MAANIGECVVFGTKHFEQALLNKLKKGDEIKVEIVTLTPKRRYRRHKQFVVKLGSYGKDYFFGVTGQGELRHFEWRQALEFRRVEESEPAKA